MMGTTQKAVTLTLTERAGEEGKKFLAEEKVPQESAGLGVAVLPGGWSGFRYSLNIEEQPAADDVVIESAGVRLFVDEFSSQYLNGTVIDYKSNFQESGFLEVALVIDHCAVEILRAEFIDKQPHARALDHDVIGRGLLFDVQAVAKARAAARQHSDAQPGGLVRHLLLGQEFLDLFARPFGERQGNRFLCSPHHILQSGSNLGG